MTNSENWEIRYYYIKLGDLYKCSAELVMDKNFYCKSGTGKTKRMAQILARKKLVNLLKSKNLHGLLT